MRTASRSLHGCQAHGKVVVALRQMSYPPAKRYKIWVRRVAKPSHS
jgi:hypothetical protein